MCQDTYNSSCGISRWRWDVKVGLVADCGCASPSMCQGMSNSSKAVAVTHADGVSRFTPGSDSRTRCVCRTRVRLHDCCVLAYQLPNDACAGSAVAASAVWCRSARAIHIQNGLFST
jgi:hypothetical protein